MLLAAEAISFQYQRGGRKVLDNVSLSIKSGECVGLAAPSGFGKTTLCKILGGYSKPNAGTVLLDGKPLADYKGYSPVQMIWQHPELVMNPRLKLQKTLQEAGVLDDRILDALGIETEWLSRYPTELSGGELQRFCIARAMGAPTRFLLADEITTMLDLVTQAQIWHFLKAEAERRQIGLLIASHSDDLLAKLCGRIINMA